MAQFFQFEADFVATLRCIPMQVRLKLDTCGIKLKLAQWHQLSQQERQNLVDLPCTTAAQIQIYRDYLRELVLQSTGQPATDLAVEDQPAWMDATQIPTAVQAKTQALNVAIALDQWANLTPLQRFALIKLSRSGHENANFLPALREFELV